MWRRAAAPRRPRKTPEQLAKERREKVASWIKAGILKSQPLIEAMLKVPREEFVPPEYRDACYQEIPIPLPAVEATISCPRTYPLFYEALQLSRGDRFLEVGTGSGYGAAIAREVVGKQGLVVSLEIDRSAFNFAKSNLSRLGYSDAILITGDGYLGYEPEAPYDKISITAAVSSVPPPLLEQLSETGLLVAPIGSLENQEIKLIHKNGPPRVVARPAVFVPMIRRRMP